MVVKGVFLLKVQKDEVRQRISRIGKRYSHIDGINFKRDIALLRTVCYDIISMMEDCFEMSMVAAIRYCAMLKDIAHKDNPTDIDVCVVYGILADFIIMIDLSIPIKDLPSCKKLIGLSDKDAIAAAKDLIKNDIVKAGMGVFLLGVEVGDMVQVSHIKDFYNNQLNLLQSDLKEAGRCANEIENYLINKFNAEIGYCNLAMLKAGIGSAKELMDLIDKSKQDIQRYENGQGVGISHCLC